MVEQRTENPRVDGSIPSLATTHPDVYYCIRRFFSPYVSTGQTGHPPIRPPLGARLGRTIGDDDGRSALIRVTPRRRLQVTEVTHDHPEGIKGARAVTEAIWLALRGEGAEAVRREITTRYSYDLEQTVEDIRPTHQFDVTCQGTVPTALVCALESTTLEDAVRNAVSLGGDADTLAAIAGAVGEALHGLDEGLVRTAREGYLQGAEDIIGALEALYERAAYEGEPDNLAVTRGVDGG